MTRNGLQDHIGYWLRRLSDEVHTSFERHLAAHDVTVAQWNVLVTVYRGDATTTTEAAKFIGIDPGAVSRLVDRLASKELITRSADPQSRRSLRLELTPAGQALVPVLIGIADQNDTAYFGSLPPTEQTELVRLLRQLLSPNTSSAQEEAPSHD